MVDLVSLESSVRRIEQIEAIKTLKYRYFRCLDCKLWEDIADCFTADATTSYADGKFSFRGVEAIVAFLKNGLPRSRLSAHYGHHPEIEIVSDTSARGVWALQDYVVYRDTNMTLKGAAFYDDVYVKENGSWRIQHTGFKRVFEETCSRAELPSLRLRSAMFSWPEE